MNRTDAIELANQLTERKGERLLDVNLLFNTVLQDICMRSRFWWRKLDVTFTMTQGTTQYDFTTITTTPVLTETAVEEVIDLALILQTTPTLNAPSLTPIFDPLGIRAIKQNTVQGQPARYSMGTVDWKTLLVDPPDKTYTAEITFWGMPVIDKDTSSNTIPLLPPYYHSTIVAGIEAAINRRVYGPDDRRAIGAAAVYENKILTMMMRKQFTTNYNQQWVTDESSVQSTAPNSP